MAPKIAQDLRLEKLFYDLWLCKSLTSNDFGNFESFQITKLLLVTFSFLTTAGHEELALAELDSVLNSVSYHSGSSGAKSSTSGLFLSLLLCLSST